jgi:aspartate/methionine/tyrosine aminotransferase
MGKLGKIEQSITVRIADMARALERQGKRVIKLQTGDPDFDTPEVIVNAAFEALKSRYTHYSDSRGLLPLREAIAQKLYRDNGLSYDPLNEILVTHGGIHAIFAILNALIEPGDQ